jgi:hypothetical protein
VQSTQVDFVTSQPVTSVTGDSEYDAGVFIAQGMESKSLLLGSSVAYKIVLGFA